MPSIPIVLPPTSSATMPVAVPNGAIPASGSSASSAWPAKQIFVAALLLIMLLLLANKFPKYTIGFMLLLLVSVALAHNNTITSFFNWSS